MSAPFNPGDKVRRAGAHGNVGMVVPHSLDDCEHCAVGEVPVVFRSSRMHLDANEIESVERAVYLPPDNIVALERILNSKGKPESRRGGSSWDWSVLVGVIDRAKGTAK